MSTNIYISTCLIRQKYKRKVEFFFFLLLVVLSFLSSSFSSSSSSSNGAIAAPAVGRFRGGSGNTGSCHNAHVAMSLAVVDSVERGALTSAM